MRLHTGVRCVGAYRSILLKRPQTMSRSFTTTKIREIKATQLSEKQLADLRVDKNRLWTELHETCEWGKGERWGE